ncbi:multisubstrate pseudouridine synthase 7 [Mangifera indica]|uniref:multisubstrate pseudouridine synthase 7 n=1 Tax=Mangifera indica TaxID=29780 RepID=UPI001CF9B84D|nr:multisubstrate pseudouridine synthase 7 [Mangifera indica]
MGRNPVSVSFSALKPYSLCNCPRVFNKTLTTPKMKTLDESDVGIFCFISDLPGFRGILKQRYSDFIVNEVDTEGNVVHLTCLDAPPEAVVEHKEVKRSDQLNKSYASEIELFRSLAGDSDADCLEHLINQITSGNDKDSISPIVLSANSDKCHRTTIHNFFKENFKFLVTDTIEGPDNSSKCIRVRLNSGGNTGSGRNSKKRKERGENPFDSRGSENWPEHQGKFLRFHLYKENKDTQEALGLITKMLGVQPRSFGFAGTKDKRSVSTQRVTVFKQHASRLAALNKRLIGIQVGDFCYVKEGLLLGQLQGNRFTVTLRGVVADSEDVIKASANSLGRLGFINYFGLQRFGSGSVPTQLIGATLLKGEWKAAVSMILDPREGERSEISKARQYYKETDDIDGTLRKLPRHLVAERAILQCLKKCPGNYLQALKAIPRTLRMMYVHSYQSYLWNHAASMRVKKYGTEQVVVGDLVYSKGDNTEKEMTFVNSESEDENSNDEDDCGRLDEVSATDLPVGTNNLVKTVTAEDVHSGKYTIGDIILPMPGSRVIYPINDVAEVYHNLAKKDGISLTERVHNVKEFSIISMTGSYRQVFQKPLDFEWELLKYTDSSKPLAETDLDKIAKAKHLNIIKVEELVAGVEKKDPSDCMEHSESLENVVKLSTDDNEADCGGELSVPQGKSLNGSESEELQTALKLGFTLPTSCYATMAIRELLKTSTSVAFHKTLNQ